MQNHRHIRTPEDWPQHVKKTLLHVASLAHLAVIHTRSWCANSSIARVRMAGKLDQAKHRIALLREELRIKDARMAKIPPRHRPHYPPTERMAILELKVVRGWNLAQAAQTFGVEPDTVASWLKRVDDDSLVQTHTPINKFPGFVRYLTQRLKVLCPCMGKQRIAQTLARAGLSLSATTVSRHLKLPFHQKPPPVGRDSDPASHRVVTARHPNHVWHVDLTTVPTSSGFWTSYIPWSFPTVWPFCWHVALAIDHYSRRVMGFALFKQPPTSLQTRHFLGMAMKHNGVQPRHIISDRGKQFDCHGYRRWCKRRGIRWRYGAIGKHGSIAVIERFIRSLKTECTRRILIPFRRVDMRTELAIYMTWHNEHRPHQALDGRTPLDVYDGTDPPPLLSIPNSKLPEMTLHVSFFEDRKHLPVVELKKAA